MTPIPPVSVDVNADKSCNHWLCCFGCSCCETKEKSPNSVSVIWTHEKSPTEEKTTEVYRTHQHHKPPLKRISPIVSPPQEEMFS